MRFGGGAVTRSSLLPFFGTRLRRQNFNLAPTQNRQLCRLWQTLQLESGRVPLSDSCQYLLSRRSTFTCSSLRTCKLQTQDLLCSVIVMESFISRLEQKGFIVSFNPKGDGSCFFSAAAHQLNQDGARLKETTFAYLLGHRFDVSIFIDSHYEHRNR